MNESDHYSYLHVSEAAAYLGLGECVVRRYAREGRIAGCLRLGRWFLPTAAVKAFALLERRRGPKARSVSDGTIAK